MEKEAFKRAATWPTVREVAETYNLSERWVRECIVKRRVTVVRLDVMRIDPDAWEAFLNNRVYPGQP